MTRFFRTMRIKPFKSGAAFEYFRQIAEYINSKYPEANFQVKVTLTAGTFDYSMVASGGTDIRFSDTEGNDLAYWIQEWDPDGTSVIWVNVENAGTDKIGFFGATATTQITFVAASTCSASPSAAVAAVVTGLINIGLMASA